jgi:signal transduction histidine kinase
VADIDEAFVDRARSTALFRVFQELLTNVSRHADATEVEVTVYQADGEVTLSVADNGRGVSRTKVESRMALGIIGMRERLLPFGGTLGYEPLRPSGTVATVVMPLPAP